MKYDAGTKLVSVNSSDKGFNNFELKAGPASELKFYIPADILKPGVADPAVDATVNVQDRKVKDWSVSIRSQDKMVEFSGITLNDGNLTIKYNLDTMVFTINTGIQFGAM
ncbi:hypothetical protein [Prochlorococcus marinus]|uniref:hypothetical protein n=1 Tax=Prochlorococcus marinus TaxID=1219 RepID=UPI0007B3C93D|nr:hypothetical protein [Prochlorococcus marinus]KZR75967.1 hypothetical protein PMIT1320_00963 [Prochlorococcus marinus str. MIT 1320]